MALPPPRRYKLRHLAIPLLNPSRHFSVRGVHTQFAGSLLAQGWIASGTDPGGAIGFPVLSGRSRIQGRPFKQNPDSRCGKFGLTGSGFYRTVIEFYPVTNLLLSSIARYNSYNDFRFPIQTKSRYSLLSECSSSRIRFQSKMICIRESGTGCKPGFHGFGNL
jgi:hypothetical protein